MFENKKIHGRYITCIIQSWLNAGGNFEDVWWDPKLNRYDGLFTDWLSSVGIDSEPLNKEEINQICQFLFDAYTGRVELQCSAAEFLLNKKYGI